MIYFIFYIHILKNNKVITSREVQFSGVFIILACFRGFFGQDCSQKCINTCAGCNGINGLCEYGCIPGWKGYFCIEGNAYNDYMTSHELFKHA